MFYCENYYIKKEGGKVKFNSKIQTFGVFVNNTNLTILALLYVIYFEVFAKKSYLHGELNRINTARRLASACYAALSPGRYPIQPMGATPIQSSPGRDNPHWLNGGGPSQSDGGMYPHQPDGGTSHLLDEVPLSATWGYPNQQDGGIPHLPGGSTPHPH